MKVDLNCDLGESFGRYQIGSDEQIVPLVSSVNVACGFHAGDPIVMMKTVELAKASMTAIGAHPGFDDLQGFGRRNLQLSYEELRACVLYQIGALDAFVKAQGMTLQHVKPHGAMYNMATVDPVYAKAIVEAVQQYDPKLIVLAQECGCLYKEAKKAGLPAAAEVFADRAYEPDGTLVNRSKEGAMIKDEEEMKSRVIQMIKSHTVTAIDGSEIQLKADSVCVHGDNERSLRFVKEIRAALADEGIEIRPLSHFI